MVFEVGRGVKGLASKGVLKYTTRFFVPGEEQVVELWPSEPGRFDQLARLSVVKIRLKRFGRKNHPFWRINAVDTRSPRDGKVIEELGFYDPTNSDTSKQVVVDKARVEFWVKNGAQPSETVAGLIKRAVDSATLVAAAAAPKA